MVLLEHNFRFIGGPCGPGAADPGTRAQNPENKNRKFKIFDQGEAGRGWKMTPGHRALDPQSISPRSRVWTRFVAETAENGTMNNRDGEHFFEKVDPLRLPTARRPAEKDRKRIISFRTFRENHEFDW